ncbi:hypothetical protein [Amycolatopsis vastitatis]|uniref:Heparin-sulfate lyase N-terminal domain-containing protein n=1 Tax=Amycolatopsis vastitatis TaxID=1905142 RepID=A0A229SSW2_9PSEU|nr:hypothetical protein [Amycolatopsis vastitatis]OXM61659.1 hypothetical protein CF165_37755 [Amycolatopsis vastitatis]
MNPILLPSQHASAHDLPDDPAHLDAVLADAVTAALAAQQPDGNFEDPAADDDIGDMALGVISLLCLAWRRRPPDDPAFPGAVRRGLDFFLANRVYRHDNPGEPFLRVRNSGLPYARYMPGDGEHPFGDWPSTVWAMLHAVNVLELGEGLLTDEQYAEVTELALGYWRWLTEASMVNPQQTANQAIGAVVAGLMLGRHLGWVSREREGKRVTTTAMRLYTDVIRPARLTDRGFALPAEHGAGHDQNYLPISLSFLAQAHRVTGDRLFLDDGAEIARHLDCRLSARGFDYGGPRYSEQHCGAEGMLGLRYFSAHLETDLGRYLADRRVTYYPVAKTGAPSGHFAFTTVWLYQDDSKWHRTPAFPVTTPYSLRHRAASVSLTGSHTPYLIDAGRAVVIESVVAGQHGIGPVLRYADGHRTLLTRALGPLRVRDARDGDLAARLVTKAVVTREQVMLSVQQLFVTDGRRVTLFAVVPAECEFLAGLPYVEETEAGQRKIVTVAEPGGAPFDLGTPGAVLHTAGTLLAGSMAITSGATLRVVNPPAGRTSFSSPETIGLTQEQLAFSLADDPRGYGNPDAGWHRVTDTNHVLAGPLPDSPPGSSVFAVRYGPHGDVPFTVEVRDTAGGLLIEAPGFSVVAGDPAGDADGEPVLRLTAHP